VANRHTFIVALSVGFFFRKSVVLTTKGLRVVSFFELAIVVASIFKTFRRQLGADFEHILEQAAWPALFVHIIGWRYQRPSISEFNNDYEVLAF